MRSSPTKIRNILSILGLLIGIGMLIFAYRISTGQNPSPGEPGHPPSGVLLQKFFKEEIQPLIVQEKVRNLAAVGRAQAELNAQFAVYISRLPTYAEELTTWGMRYEITKAAITDWWSNENRVRTIATEKFSEKVLSEKQLEAGVRNIIQQFQSDLEANRNQMLAEASVRLKAAQFNVPSLPNSDNGLRQALEVKLKPLLESQAKQSPAFGILAFGGSVVLEEATRFIVVQAVRTLTASLAASAATAGGATATAATTGGGAGTILGSPGVGTAIGIAVGIGVGVAVDSCMSGKFREKVIAECQLVLETMNQGLWSGPNGLEATFTEAVNSTVEMHSVALKTIITGERP